MEWKLFLTVFGTVFLAATLALAATSAIAVAAGSVVSQALSPRLMSLLAGSGFILVGAWILWQAWNT